MAQDRLLHKTLGHSEKINQLSDFEFIVWSCYVLTADDFGVMRLSAVTLRADHDRLESKSDGAIERALNKCVQVGLLKTFIHQNRRYVYQHDWQDYQKIRYPGNTTNPIPSEAELAECSKKTRDLFGKHAKAAPQKSANPSDDAPQKSGAMVALNTANANANGSSSGSSFKKEQGVVPFRQTGHPPMALGLRRFKVWRWMIDDFMDRLGDHADAFDLEAWFHALDVRDRGVVPTGKDAWAWLQAEFMAEVRRRGLDAATPSMDPLGKQTNRLMAAVAGLSDQR